VIHDIRAGLFLCSAIAAGPKFASVREGKSFEEELLMQQINRVVLIVVATFLSTAVLACNRGPDPKEQVTKALDAANIQDVNVDWDDDAKLLHLKGAVDSSAERAQAESVAVRAVGTTGQVVNELTVEGQPTEIADDFDGAIRDRLDTLAKDQAFDGRDINFDVNNGVVTIKGYVKSQAEKERIGEMARKTAGVKEVVNALEISS
jgi:hyperosmotically inducible periplasmic protein